MHVKKQQIPSQLHHSIHRCRTAPSSALLLTEAKHKYSIENHHASDIPISQHHVLDTPINQN